MKKLRFHYDMELMFSNPVAEHHFVFRCLPAEDRQQRCYGLTCEIEPSGGVLELTDGFGNRTCVGESMEPHDSLRVHVAGTVFVDRSLAGEKADNAHALFRFPSAYTMADRRVREFLEDAKKAWKPGNFQGSGSVGSVREGGEFWGPKDERSLDFLLYLMNLLYSYFSYVPGKTDVTTTAAQALEGGGGVCQDYAHIFLSMCRLMGFPARYVAGMMVGEGATHAWTEVWTDGAWIGFDPTNNRLAGDDYIKLSHGRDFGDCTIDKGCFKGFAAQKQNIHVKVEESYGEDCGFRRSSGR